MKKLSKQILVFVVFLMVIMLFPFSKVLGCEVSIVPSKTEVSLNEVISVDILRTQTHKTCVLPLDATKIEITGGEIVKDYPWIEGNPDKKTIEVKFTQVGDGLITVTRDCPKGGLMVWTATVKVVSSGVSSQTTQPSGSSAPPATNTDNPANTNSTNQNSASSQPQTSVSNSSQSDTTSLQQNTEKDSSLATGNVSTVQDS
ncbi:MAG: hypothetical protein ACP5SB_01480 [Caldisericaceae bacterium]